MVGFAAETDNLIAEARRKLETKNCDMIVANLVASSKGAEEDSVGFDSDENEVVLVTRSGELFPSAAPPNAPSRAGFSTK